MSGVLLSKRASERADCVTVLVSLLLTRELPVDREKASQNSQLADRQIINEMSTSRLQLHLSAKNLKNLGGLLGGKSDPFAVVTVRGDNANNKPVVVGQTDV